MTIYDWANDETQIQIDEPISHIHVLIQSGDEIVTVNGKDRYDSGVGRLADFFDGEYDVDGDDIEKWLNWKPNKRDVSCYAYQRRNAFRRPKHE